MYDPENTLNDAASNIRSRILITLVAMVLASAYWPALISRHPQSWDEIQYMMGVREYDLEAHQPHPPGYFLHVKTASFIARFCGDERTALITLSMIAGVAFTGLVVWWATSEGGLWGGVFAAILTVGSPLVATAATEGRSYMTGGLGACVTGYLSYLTLSGRKPFGFPAGIALGLTAGFRPTAALFVLPLWLWSAVRSGGVRTLLSSGMATAAALAVWVIPFLNAVGGFADYLDISARLGGLVAGGSPLAGGGLEALMRNLGRTGAGFSLMLGTGIVGVLVAPQRPGLLWTALLWTLPATCFLILVHTGTPLYAMVFAAPLLVLASTGLARIPADSQATVLRVAVVSVIAAAHLLLITGTVNRSRSSVDGEITTLAGSLAEFDDPRTVVLTMFGTEPDAGEGYLPFRHACYLFRESPVYLFPVELPGPPGTMPNHCYQDSTGLVQPPVVVRDARYILLLASPLKRYLPDGRDARRVLSSSWLEAWLTPVNADEEIILGPGGRLEIVAET